MSHLQHSHVHNITIINVIEGDVGDGYTNAKGTTRTPLTLVR